MSPRAYGPWDARQERYCRTVYSEDELRTVLRALAGSSGVGTRLQPGGMVIFGCPITFRSPVIVSEQLPGITITAAAKFPIRAASLGVSSLFEVRAEFVTVRDLFVYGDTNGYFTTLATTGSSFSSGRSANAFAMLDCDFFGDRLFVDASAGKCDNARIIGNRQAAEANGAHGVPVVVDSDRCHVVDNDLRSGGGDGITVGANGGECVLRGNNLNGATITTTGSSGKTAITGNTNCGVITTVAGDVSSGNT
jgi:hypothetical protein